MTAVRRLRYVVLASLKRNKHFAGQESHRPIIFHRTHQTEFCGGLFPTVSLSGCVSPLVVCLSAYLRRSACFRSLSLFLSLPFSVYRAATQTCGVCDPRNT